MLWDVNHHLIANLHLGSWFANGIDLFDWLKSAVQHFRTCWMNHSWIEQLINHYQQVCEPWLILSSIVHWPMDGFINLVHFGLFNQSWSIQWLIVVSNNYWPMVNSTNHLWPTYWLEICLLTSINPVSTIFNQSFCLLTILFTHPLLAILFTIYEPSFIDQWSLPVGSLFTIYQTW